VKKTTLRHLAGGLILAGGGIVIMVGAVVLAASAFDRTGALSKAANVASVVPGGEAAAVPLRRAHARIQSRS
jgi:hypothetical protein